MPEAQYLGMGESEAKSFTITAQGVPASGVKIIGLPLPQDSLPLAPSATQPIREVWPGKDYELAKKVRDELGRDWTPAEFTAALATSCERYESKKGKRYTVKSLREGLRQRDAFLDGKARRQR